MIARHSGSDVKRVGKSGQVSVGKELAGSYFREERREDGAIVLVPVAVLPSSHWSIRDSAKIKKALAWAAAHPPAASDVDAVINEVRSPRTRKRRAR